MLVIKVVNQQLAQVAFAAAAGQQPSRLVFSSSLAHSNRKQLGQLVRTLVQSSAQSQKITNANNQQLIPVARNISFRRCQQQLEQQRASRGHETSAKASFSISAAAPPAQFAGGQLEAAAAAPFSVAGERESPFEQLLKRRRPLDIEERRQEVDSKQSKYYGQSFNEASTALAAPNGRRLVVLLSWLEAKEKHIEKYRQFYLERGFDVLNVKTSPLDLLLPNRGAKKISEDFVRFMVERQYSNVLLHGFSVGGYMFGRFLLEIDQRKPDMRQQLLSSIRGIVFDSLVPIEGVAVGVANSITSNQAGARAIEQLLKLYLFLGESVATKYFRQASDKVWGGPLKCPTLFLMSRDDPISDHRIVERLAAVWSGLGIECHKMLVDSSPHVQLYTKHRAQYVEKVDRFLEHVKLA